MSCEACRPFSGNPTICSSVIVVPTPVLRVSTIAALAVTVTFSSTAPIFNETLMTGFAPTDSVMPVALVGAEALQLGFELVGTDGQVAQHVLAPLVGDDRTGGAGRDLGHQHVDARKGAAGLIAHHSGDLGDRDGLCTPCTGKEDQRHRQANDTSSHHTGLSH